MTSWLKISPSCIPGRLRCFYMLMLPASVLLVQCLCSDLMFPDAQVMFGLIKCKSSQDCPICIHFKHHFVSHGCNMLALLSNIMHATICVFLFSCLLDQYHLLRVDLFSIFIVKHKLQIEEMFLNGQRSHYQIRYGMTMTFWRGT